MINLDKVRIKPCGLIINSSRITAVAMRGSITNNALKEVFGKRAPLILTEALLDLLKPGSVVIDGAVDSGGNVEGISADSFIERKGVTLVGYRNLAGRVPHDASRMYSANLCFLLKELADPQAKEWVLDPQNEIFKAALVTFQGELQQAKLTAFWQGRLG